MNSDETGNKKNDPYEKENKAAEKLAEELESPFGAEKLGKEAYEMAKKDNVKKGNKH